MTTDELMERHARVLLATPAVRPLTRWGRRTEYVVEITRRTAADLLGIEAGEERRAWRLLFGVELDPDGGSAFTCAVGYMDPDAGGIVADEAMHDDHDAIIDRATAWLRARYPQTEELIEIDGALLRRTTYGEG